jgi:hypothetical protein
VLTFLRGMIDPSDPDPVLRKILSAGGSGKK